MAAQPPAQPNPPAQAPQALIQQQAPLPANPIPQVPPANPNMNQFLGVLPSSQMPNRKERSTPTFDKKQPEELELFFNELEDLMDQFSVIDENERKEAALKYLNIPTKRFWQLAVAYKDCTKTYANFKAEIFSLYLKAQRDQAYSLQDLEMVIGHYANHQIVNSNDLSEYYSRFVTITRYLINLGKISNQEQSKAFFQGMHAQLRDKVLLRLQQKYVDYDQDTSYPINQIYEATDFILAGGSTTVSMNWQQPTIPTTGTTTATPTTTMTIMSSTDPTAVKIEALTSAISSLGEMFKTIIQN